VSFNYWARSSWQSS